MNLEFKTILLFVKVPEKLSHDWGNNFVIGNQHFFVLHVRHKNMNWLKMN